MMVFTQLLLLLSTCIQVTGYSKEFPIQVVSSEKKDSTMVVFGKVIDSISESPIFEANILITDATTGNRIGEYVSNDKGEFNIQGLIEGKEYAFMISYVGYHKINERLDIYKREQIFKLLPQVKDLDEVVVKAKKDLFEFDGDKVIYDVERDPHSANSSTIDILRKVPFVTAGPDDNISVNGSSKVQVLINGKRRNMGTGNSSDLLRFIQPKEISRIEVYTSPGVKFDADESAVINIITRKKNIEGWRLDINAGLGNRGANSNSFAQINNKHFSITGSILGSWLYNKSDGGTTINDLSGNTLVESKSDGKLNIGNYSRNLNLNINISPKTTAYLELNNKNRSANNSRDASYNFGKDTSTISFLETSNIAKNRNFSAEVVHQFNKIENQISVFFQNGKTVNDNIFKVSTPESLFAKNRGEGAENTFQIDWQNAPTRKTFIEMGIKGINRVMEVVQHEDNSTNPFQQRQSILAGYSSYSIELKNKIKIRAGVRYENMLQESENGNKRYSNIFPNVQLSKKILNQGNIKASYSQRIVRPSIAFLNPNVSPTDQINVWVGNPNLVPEKIHNWELSFSKTVKKGTLLLNGYFRSSTNPIGFFDTYINSAKIVMTQVLNFEKESTVGTNNFISVKINNRIHCSINSNVGYKWINGGNVTENKKNSGIFYNGSFLTTYEMNKKTLIQFLGGINSKSIHIQGSMPGFQYMNLGVRRNFKDNKGYYSIGIDNPFNRKVALLGKTQTKDVAIDSRTILYGQGIRLMINYKIGKGSNKTLRKRNNKDVSDLKETEGNI